MQAALMGLVLWLQLPPPHLLPSLNTQQQVPAAAEVLLLFVYLFIYFL